MKAPVVIETNQLVADEKELQVSHNLQAYAHAATSDNTRKAYRDDAQHFIAWGGLLPTTPDVLLRYLEAHAPTLNPQTLRRRLTALKHWHTYQNLPDPTSHPLVLKTMSGIIRVHGRPADKSPALTLEQLATMVEYLNTHNRLVDARNNALVQTGFFGAFRRSELAAIHWEHVSFVPEGMEILIPRSKTDQDGEGRVCAIPFGNETLCAVSALKRWQEMSGLTTGPTFRSVSRKNMIATRALSPVSAGLIVKQLAIACHLPNANDYSGHSLRRGFATAASQKGATLTAIMRQGRWKNERTVNGYIEEGQRFEDNAAGLLLK
tara:strand:- start:168 stop:1130 length:963 start_codon:yes stop_codon:yes gene_type:complete